MMANETEFWLEGEAIAPETIAMDPAASERPRQNASDCQHPNRQ